MKAFVFLSVLFVSLASDPASAAERIYRNPDIEAFLTQTLIWERQTNGGFTMHDRLASAEYAIATKDHARSLFVRFGLTEPYATEVEVTCRQVGAWGQSECPADAPTEGWQSFSADAKLVYQTLIDQSQTLEFLGATIGARPRVGQISIDDSAPGLVVMKVAVFDETGDYFPNGVERAVKITRSIVASETSGSEYRYEVEASVKLPNSWGMIAAPAP